MTPPRQSDTGQVVPHGARWVGDTLIDAQGNPCIRVGCPNCGEGAGWLDPISYSAGLNSGVDAAGPCSRRCRYQLEYAETLGPRGVPSG